MLADEFDHDSFKAYRYEPDDLGRWAWQPGRLTADMLRRIHQAFVNRERQRRADTITFSNGLVVAKVDVVVFCERYGKADFCIYHGVERAELERVLQEIRS